MSVSPASLAGGAIRLTPNFDLAALLQLQWHWVRDSS
jgi:hypothetical protein